VHLNAVLDVYHIYNACPLEHHDRLILLNLLLVSRSRHSLHFSLAILFVLCPIRQTDFSLLKCQLNSFLHLAMNPLVILFELNLCVFVTHCCLNRSDKLILIKSNELGGSLSTRHQCFLKLLLAHNHELRVFLQSLVLEHADTLLKHLFLAGFEPLAGESRDDSFKAHDRFEIEGSCSCAHEWIRLIQGLLQFGDV